MNQEVVHTRNWGVSSDSGKHCKMVISASDKLNGKLVINLKTVDDAEVHVFMMPKNFNADYGYIGLFENNDYYTYQSSGTYTAPSDWYFIV